MKRILLWIWQLPQNLLGTILVLIVRAKKTQYKEIILYHTSLYSFGVSLGSYIILGDKHLAYITIMHEYGHQKQSLYLGWLYLLVIGLPSITGNIFDRIFHKKWSNTRRIKWYYSLLWEAWADRLGGVIRN